MRSPSWRDVTRKLKKAGFAFDRQAKGSHEIYYNPKTKRRVTIPNHPGDLSKFTKGGTLKAIKQLGLTVEEILKL